MKYDSKSSVKMKIIYMNDAFVTLINSEMTYEGLRAEVRQILDLMNDTFTMKWVDSDGDPIMLTSQPELEMAVTLFEENKDVELMLYVFPSLPDGAGKLCPGEDMRMYRHGAKRWKKFYHLFGHKFTAKRFNKNAECYFCKDRIWGLGQQGLRCGNCRLLLHKRCQNLVRNKCGDDLSQPGALTVGGSSTAIAVRQITLAQQQRLLNGGGSENPGYYVDPPAFVDETSKGDNSGEMARATGKIGIKDFNLLCVVGRGSYAKVFQVEFKPTRKIYAMKVIKKEFITDSDDIEWVQTEKHVFECASNYPFLVGLHSCFQTPSRLIYVIEFVNGGDLMFHMQRKLRLPEEHARFYAAEIACALNYLHRRAIVYRDLKLDNVLMDHEGHLKLTDYGMCKEGIEGDIKATTFCGTPNYIAPEILRNESYGASVDWWSLGVLMFEMLAGCSPWMQPGHGVPPEESTEDYLFNLILSKPIRIPRSISARASSILKGLLVKDPLLRLACAPSSNFSELQEHAFFRGLDWSELEQRRIEPPFRPELGHERDLTNFDPVFTEEPAHFTPDEPDQLARIDQTEFEGFEYVNPLLLTTEEAV